MRKLAIIAAFASLPAIAPANILQWETDSQRFETKFGDAEVTAVYAFKNVTDAAVTIVDSKASCGCTVPSLEKTTYQPGESGELTTVFTIGSRLGEQSKTVDVSAQSASGEIYQYTLQLNVSIPIPVTLRPRVRFWEAGAVAVTQTVEVSFHESMPIELQGLALAGGSGESAFEIEIETVKPQHEYKVHLTPLDPGERTREILVLQGAGETEPMLSNFPIYAYLR